MPVAFVPQTAAPTHLGSFRQTALQAGTASRMNAGIGVPFLDDVLVGARLVVLIRYAGWTDVTADLLQDPPVTITPIGRSNQSDIAQPARATLRLKNLDRRHSQHDPLSPNYPWVRENAKLWIKLFVDGQYFTRYYGEIKGFKPVRDITGNYSAVDVSAAGQSQRIGAGRAGRGKSSPESAMRRAVTRTTAPIAYWTLEDANGATVAASALSSYSTPLNATGFTTPALAPPTFGSIDGPAGSDRLPDFTNKDSLAAYVPASASTPWSFGIAAKVPTIASGQSVYLMRIYHATGTVWYWDLYVKNNSEGGISLAGLDFGGDTNFQITTSHGIDDGDWHWIKVDAMQSGANILVNVYVDGVRVTGPSTVASRTLGPVRSMLINQTQPNSLTPAVGHMALWNTTSVSDLTDAMNGYAGETPTQRLTRLCAQEGITFEAVDSYTSTATMGPQGTDSLMNLLRECELVDGGMLYDGLSDGFRLQGLGSRYNQASLVTLDASPGAGEVQPPWEPAADDYGRANRVTVSRKDGSSAVAEDVDGPLGSDTVGVAEASLPQSVNYETDDPLYFRAAWEVHKGSGRPGFRYPSVSLNLRKIPSKILTGLATGWLTIRPGDAFTILSPYTENSPDEDIRLIAEGWSEILTRLRWELTANCSRADVYDVFRVQDTRLGRVGTGGALTLAADAPAGSSSLSVATAAGSVLATTTATRPGDFPLDVDVAGIQVTVTAIAGTSSPQTFTVDPSTVIKDLRAGDVVAPWRPGVIAL